MAVYAKEHLRLPPLQVALILGKDQSTAAEGLRFIFSATVVMGLGSEVVVSSIRLAEVEQPASQNCPGSPCLSERLCLLLLDRQLSSPVTPGGGWTQCVLRI
jgi:hypothetical protein